MKEHLIFGIINCLISFVYFFLSLYIKSQWIYSLPLFFCGIGFLLLHIIAKIKESRKKERVCYIWTNPFVLNYCAIICSLCSIGSTNCCEPGNHQIRTTYEKDKIIEYYFMYIEQIPANEFIEQSNKGIYL